MRLKISSGNRWGVGPEIRRGKAALIFVACCFAHVLGAADPATFSIAGVLASGSIPPPISRQSLPPPPGTATFSGTITLDPAGEILTYDISMPSVSGIPAFEFTNSNSIIMTTFITAPPSYVVCPSPYQITGLGGSGVAGIEFYTTTPPLVVLSIEYLPQLRGTQFLSPVTGLYIGPPLVCHIDGPPGTTPTPYVFYSEYATSSPSGPIVVPISGGTSELQGQVPPLTSCSAPSGAFASFKDSDSVPEPERIIIPPRPGRPRPPPNSPLSITIDTSAAGKQPNILMSGEQTILDINVFPNAATPMFLLWTDVTASVTPAQTTTDSLTGHACATYTASTATTEDDVLAIAIPTTSEPPRSSAVPVYEFNKYFDSNQTVRFNIHQSQVNNATFINSNDLNASQIQAFLTKVVSGGSIFASLYLDTTNPGGGGWIGPGTGAEFDVYNGPGTIGDPNTYCVSSTECPQPVNTKTGMKADTGRLAAFIIADAAANHGINPKLLLIKLQVEHQLIQQNTKPSDGALNNAFGCNFGDTFLEQLDCAASVYYGRFSEASSLTFPYFFPKVNNRANQNIQYAVTLAAPKFCDDNTLVSGCVLVAYAINDAATYSQIKYTPFVQSSTSGGGVRLFEQLWFNYSRIW